ncbi:hypothetical protein BDM02DRAFT_3132570 [Thelephora ganbajun]|uniref:Uncharacterized protein n=1 Tax=Thelephora ganbajun TaxID=370292 RepID=A0ACB6Z156_THEGA|nr:hypothetical protein BDM02DRAFT_3132570 [Thelephora ganbajun]
MVRSARLRGPSVKASKYAELDDSCGDTDTEEQEWNEHSVNGVGKTSSSRPSGKPPSKQPIPTDVGDKENTTDGCAPNGAGGASGSSGRTTDVMNSNFEEWIKMATDSTINTNNSWNFALIDYFHDMSLLRNNTNNSVNFQRASIASKMRQINSFEVFETVQVEETLTTMTTQTVQMEVLVLNELSGRELTVPKHFSQIRRPTQEQEARSGVSVDPLFKKTCGDFDEGGVHGSMIHLSLGVGVDGGGLRVVFDASDAVAKSGDDEEADEVEPVETVDLRELKDHSSMYRGNTLAFTQEDLGDDDAGDNGPIGYTQEDMGDSVPFDGGDTQEPAPVQDFVSSDQANQDGYTGDGDFGGDDDFGGDGENGSAGADADRHVDDGMSGPGRGTFVLFGPTRGPNERDPIMAMMKPDVDGGTMDYFNKNTLKNLTGLEHRKLRKVTQKRVLKTFFCFCLTIWEQTTAAVSKRKRERKETFKINFYEPLGVSAKESAKEKFAPPTRTMVVGGLVLWVPGGGGDESDLMATLAGSSRMDVRKLKENIRKSLNMKVPKPKGPDESMDVDDEGENGGSLTDPTEPRVFDSVVPSLRGAYRKDKTSSCFLFVISGQ